MLKRAGSSQIARYGRYPSQGDCQILFRCYSDADPDSTLSRKALADSQGHSGFGQLDPVAVVIGNDILD